MIAGVRANDKAFKGAMIASAAAHAVLLALIAFNPALPKKASPKGVIHYISMGRIGGSGGRPAGSGGAKAQTAAPAPQKESLRDLTTPDKAASKVESKLRHPVDPKTKAKKTPEKKATISQPGTGAAAAIPGGIRSDIGGGAGLTIGPGGTGTGEGGFGEGFGDGLADFPYAYYLQRVQDKISVNWFPGSVDPGPDNILQTLVYFQIFRNGKISTVSVKQSSGQRAFDLFAVRAVTNAADFPPLPDDYDGEYLGINLLFEHAR
ncbi:MAG: cell envelope integrity protein TolA [Candidatus Aminicenantales bacterium]